ncbi:MAG: hypothetical protein FWB99_10745, partial [Treponema sp.]|nr:hypothetical protein [Treponema sp.]
SSSRPGFTSGIAALPPEIAAPPTAIMEAAGVAVDEAVTRISPEYLSIPVITRVLGTPSSAAALAGAGAGAGAGASAGANSGAGVAQEVSDKLNVRSIAIDNPKSAVFFIIISLLITFGTGFCLQFFGQRPENPRLTIIILNFNLLSLRLLLMITINVKVSAQKIHKKI